MGWYGHEDKLRWGRKGAIRVDDGGSISSRYMFLARGYLEVDVRSPLRNLFWERCCLCPQVLRRRREVLEAGLLCRPCTEPSASRARTSPMYSDCSQEKF